MVNVAPLATMTEDASVYGLLEMAQVVSELMMLAEFSPLTVKVTKKKPQINTVIMRAVASFLILFPARRDLG